MFLESLSKISTKRVVFQVEKGYPRSKVLLKCSPVTNLLLAAILWPLAHSAFAADSELTNYKSGIALNFGDSATDATDKGVRYMEEYFYFDKVLDDHKVVYIKSDTLISMGHNSLNISGNPDGSDTYASAGLDVGVIRFKVDGDQRVKMDPASWPSYSGPFNFNSLNYGHYGNSGVPVVGTTGDNGLPQTLANKETRYFRGMLDSAGNEWHTLTLTDDDRAVTNNIEYLASDGKIWYFVVNPKTPCATWRVSGTGQFYTTPPKTYFVPKIYNQTTYFSGTVTCELRDINGNNVFYRINGGTFINAGTNHVTLNQENFNVGTNTLEYYYAGNAAHTMTRRVVKNPGYPSAGEAHGNRLWVNSASWTNIVRPSLLNDTDKAWWIDQWKRGNKDASRSLLNTSSRTTGRSTPDAAAFSNALVAKIYGMTFKDAGAQYTAADYAKMSMMATRLVLDPVGNELNSVDAPIPTRELTYRGYYDVRPIYSTIAAYDIIAGDYRANQGFANGLTPIEDYFIRDTMARWVQRCGIHTQGGGDPAWYKLDGGGMWDTAHKTAAAMVACMMPNYSTEYFGTCGLDGNTTTFNSVLYPTLNNTWFNLYINNNVAATGYPQVASRMGVNEYLFLSDGTWHDRISYASTSLMGQCFGLYYNLLKLFHPTKNLPNLNLAMTKAANGELEGDKFTSASDSNPRFYPWTIMANAWNPAFRASVAASVTSTQIGTDYNEGGIFSVLWHDVDLPLGSGAGTQSPSLPQPSSPSPPTNLRVIENP
jgi:hypothetical protein